jgi:AcrR family transcriptional regulator
LCVVAGRAEKTRAPLSRDRVLSAAVALADEHGIDALTMRRLGQDLGVEAMSLYNHVSNKNDILDGVVEVVAGEVLAAAEAVPAPDDPADWQPVMRGRILAARNVLLGHRWAPAVLETRATAPPAVLQHFDALLGLMLDAGFSIDLAHHALHALGSRTLGFAQDLFVDGDDEIPPEMAAVMLQQMASQYPRLGELVQAVFHDTGSTLGSGCDDQFEFEFGLDLILDGLERLRAAAWQHPSHVA